MITLRTVRGLSFGLSVLLLWGCSRPEERYGFVARLGNDTVSLERVSRSGNTLTSDEIDRFPRLRKRHTVATLGDDGALKRLEMDIETPSEPEKQRVRHVIADVSTDSVLLVKRDGNGGIRWAFATAGGMAMPHLPQMYSFYEMYLDAALQRGKRLGVPLNDTVQMRQFYIDREFDRFPLHRGIVWDRGGGKVEIAHDWLAGIAEATLDSNRRLVSWSGDRTTYKVHVQRVVDVPDVASVYTQWVTQEARTGVRQLSVRDTVRATVGRASLTVDYSRPLARGRTLLGDVIPYDRVWRTGANAATQFTTTAPVTVAGFRLKPGTYTLWTLPRQNGAELIVNGQSGQWGTSYDASQDVGRAPLRSEPASPPVEAFTISVQPGDARHGTLALAWGPFRWMAPIVAE
jgi:hypothetical protein